MFERFYLSTRKHLSRRHFLRGAGATMALPLLDAMTPAFARGDEAALCPRRMIAINVDLGFMPEEFFPKESGNEFRPSPYLRLLNEFRRDYTVFSGVSHPEVDGGHQADVSFLTGAPHPRSAGFKNTISLDQFAAQHIGHLTRFPTLNLRVGPGAGSMSYTADGVRIPSEERPSRVYEKLFVQGSPDEVAAQIRKLREGRSLMDSFAEQISSLSRDVGGPDRARLDQYFSSLREVEKRLAIDEQWQNKPKPPSKQKPPKDNLAPGELVERTRNMYDLARLALETDSTRLVTIFVTQGFNPKVDLPGVDLPHHALTHQSQKQDTREQLRIIEEAQMRELARLLGGLQAASEGGETLLDRTMVMQGSNLGHAGKHDNHNLPVLLAGGGFKHGQHLVYDRERNTPLANLYVSMLQRLGIEADKFSSGNGTISGLEQMS
ncbi:hypothetical protein Mal15_09200 [Stieleria maiorica]|uniref:DUF1552 domain-containing protein n=1 Tax=Stieleria maiorica TaxID=2795974 RepID=A0A5B9MA02_9BACT|nr:DUF1552 domain-containing protein [Stieleria maiorica]QEF96890.1 hypothetical protein Mal15_09200 [Stieleria maiorica]